MGVKLSQIVRMRKITNQARNRFDIAEFVRATTFYCQVGEPKGSIDQLDIADENTNTRNQEGEPSRKRKKVFSKESTDEVSDPLPEEYRHIRLSERKVHPRFYHTCAALAGLALSIPEQIKAVVIVANKTCRQVNNT